VDRTATGKGFWVTVVNNQQFIGGYHLTITQSSTTTTSSSSLCYKQWTVHVNAQTTTTFPVTPCSESTTTLEIRSTPTDTITGSKVCQVLTISANSISFAKVDAAVQEVVTVFRANALNQLSALTATTVDLQSNALSSIASITTAAMDANAFDPNTGPYTAAIQEWNTHLNSSMTEFNSWAANATQANKALIGKASLQVEDAAALLSAITNNERDLNALKGITEGISLKVVELDQLRAKTIAAVLAYKTAVNKTQYDPVKKVYSFLANAPPGYDWSTSLDAAAWTLLGEAQPIICNPIPPSGCVSSWAPDTWFADITCWKYAWIQNLVLVFAVNSVGILLMPVLSGLTGSTLAKAACHEIYGAWPNIYNNNNNNKNEHDDNDDNDDDENKEKDKDKDKDKDKNIKTIQQAEIITKSQNKNKKIKKKYTTKYVADEEEEYGCNEDSEFLKI
jgi:hypothetical protein